MWICANRDEVYECNTLVHMRHCISGEKFIAIISLFPFLPSFW